MRLFRIFAILALLTLIPFLIWGERFTRLFDGAAARQFVQDCGAWGSVAVVGLLVSDLFLPVPATGVMSAAGYVYGPWLGGALSALGSFLSGMLAFGLCRAFGHRAAVRLAGETGLAQNEALFRRAGPWLIALSRGLPILPEVTACLAGLSRMRTSLFIIALLCGSVPMGFGYAAVGTLFAADPAWALGASVLVPCIIWLAIRPFLRRHLDESASES
jgi:uncharacterized membrane protein YdjX (TVP38/TMEM64 family)